MLQRSERIFTALDPESRPDAIVIVNATAAMIDTTFKYVSGVTRGGFGGCAAVLRPGVRPTLVVSVMEEESAGTAPDCDVVAFATPAAQKEILSTLLGGAERVGVNDAAIVRQKVKLVQQVAPGAELVDVSHAIVAARLVKDEIEIDRIRRACRVTSEVAAEIPSMLREGMTEKRLEAEIEAAIRDRGGKTAFDTIVCFGKNGSEPHYSPGDVPLKRGDMILIDFGTELEDYNSDITRMFLFGEASPAQRAMFDVVRRAQAEAVEMTRNGTPARDLHRHVVKLIDGTEFAGRFIHGLGHSIGLDVHDGGGLSEASEITLCPGMIMTIEPGVYVPGIGGVRIEDTVLVTENGPEILTDVTKDLVEVRA